MLGVTISARPTPNARRGSRLPRVRFVLADRLGDTGRGSRFCGNGRARHWRRPRFQGILGAMSIKLVDTKDITPAVAVIGAGASGTLLASHLLAPAGRAWC